VKRRISGREGENPPTPISFAEFILRGNRRAQEDNGVSLRGAPGLSRAERKVFNSKSPLVPLYERGKWEWIKATAFLSPFRVNPSKERVSDGE
jgi:hypothetical protein